MRHRADAARAFVLALILALLAAGTSAHAERRLALVVGNAAYEHAPHLANPLNDAGDIAAALERLGFEVTLARDLDQAGFARTLSQFEARLEGADVALFYYAGHALQLDSRNYLVSVNAQLENEFMVQSEAMSLDQVVGLMEARSPVNLVFLDACRNNPFAEALQAKAKARGRSAAVSRGLARVETSGRDTLIAFAAAPGQVASDGGRGERNSPFTKALLAHIDTPGLEVSTLLKLVARDVRESTDPPQRPQQLSDMARLFFFKPSEAVKAPAPAPSKTAADIEFEFWRSVKDSRNPALLRSYLEVYPKGSFATLARAIIADLEGGGCPQPPGQQQAAIDPGAPAAPAPEAVAPPDASDPILIGAAGPMTGNQSAFGGQIRTGVRAAVDAINSNGGLLGRQVKVKFYDDRCDAKLAAEKAQQAVEDGVKLMVGHFCSSSSIPASDIYEQAGVIQITPASTNPKLTERGYRNVFRICSRDDRQGPVAARYVAERLKPRRVLAATDQSGYGTSLVGTFVEELASRGIQVPEPVVVNPENSDQSGVADQVRRARADVLYFGGYHDTAANIAKALRAAGLKTVFIAGDALVTNEFPTLAGDAANGTLVTTDPYPRSIQSARDVVAAIEAKGQSTEGYTIYAYAAVEAWAGAVRNQGTTDAAEISKFLHGGLLSRLSTALGAITFDAKGDVMFSGGGHVVYRWQNGTYSEVR